MSPSCTGAAALVTEFDDELRTLVEDMFETNVAANGVGLAAPQIGVGLRVFIWKMANDDGVPEQGHVINPTVTISRIPQDRPDPDEETEGCLSVPGEAFPLKRADRATWSASTSTATASSSTPPAGSPAACSTSTTTSTAPSTSTGSTRVSPRRRARRSRAMGGASPGTRWLPGVDEDPFGHDDDSAPVEHADGHSGELAG